MKNSNENKNLRMEKIGEKNYYYNCTTEVESPAEIVECENYLAYEEGGTKVYSGFELLEILKERTFSEQYISLVVKEEWAEEDEENEEN